jgi:hypothetical protein
MKAGLAFFGHVELFTNGFGHIHFTVGGVTNYQSTGGFGYEA